MTRFKGRQARFLLTTLGGWVAARAWLLWPAAPLAVGGALVGAGGRHDALPSPEPAQPQAFAPARAAAPPHPPPPGRRFAQLPAPRAGGTLLAASADGYGDGTARLLRHASFAAPAPPANAAPAPPPVAPLPAPPRPPAAAPRRIEGEAYLFVRPGSGRAALAPGGSLGGSQLAARVAVPIAGTRLAAAARVYAPLHAAGAEAAIGLDWRPLAGVPVRVSVERRVGLDAAGRHAWSAYLAGGVLAGHLPARLQLDGYAQAGVVGLARRDLFADGAVRLGRRTALAGVELVAGAGAWAAAQPGVARLDAGPRLAAALPLAGHRLSLAVEGRFRLAGRASPGSGAALTLAADF